jgi:hypothetical protein
MLDASGSQHLLLAETLGLAMARHAAVILDRHRAALVDGAVPGDDDDQFASDNAVFTAVLDAASECLGRLDTRPGDDRWCDALLQVINLARLASWLPAGGASRLVGDGHLAEQGPVVLRDRGVDDPRGLLQVRRQGPLRLLEVRRGDVRDPGVLVAERLDQHVLLRVGQAP